MSTLSVEDALNQAGDSLETAASLLWLLDNNRLRPTIDYRLDVQARTEAYSHDAARYPLFEHFDDQVWQRPTYGLFKRLLDNYTAETGVPEVVSQEERAEEESFLSALCETSCIQFVYRWLQSNSNMNCDSMEDFSQMLKEMWFFHYSRDATRDSSGFEHAFCGELDDGKVKGLHNFVQVLIEEARGNFNYQGYLDIRGEPCPEVPPANQQLITIRFEWLGETKPVSSMFVGVSPEFEFALYTLIYVSGREELEVQLGPYNARIKVYQMDGKIGTAFPELLGVDMDMLAQEEATPTYGLETAEQTAAPSGYSPEDPVTSFPGLSSAVAQGDFPALGSLAKPVSEAISYASALLGDNEQPGSGGVASVGSSLLSAFASKQSAPEGEAEEEKTEGGSAWGSRPAW